MKVTRTLRFELGQEELVNVEELVIVLNPGNGIEPKVLKFDKDFNLINAAAPAVPEAELGEEKIGENFISTITAEKSKCDLFLPPVPQCEKTLMFRRSELKPYTMAITHEDLLVAINTFTFGKNRKVFENKIYEFFIENPLGQKFYFKQMSPWHIGLWLVMDPYGLLEACGGAVTFRAIEFSFRDIRKQLEERIIKIHGHLPVHVKPVIKEKRKYTKHQVKS